MTFKIGLIGCGGMGMRHIFGHIELRKHFNDIELAAVCDVHKNVAEKAVDIINESGLKKPDIYTDYMELINSRHLDGIAIVTSTPMHHKIAIASMELGLHVITEKPMGLTMKACRLMEESAKRTNRVLAVAENYRRDPINRLSKELLDSGVVGDPYFALDIHASSSRKAVMHSTVWRAKKQQAGGIVLDAGVHNSDMLLYLMGPAESVYAETSVFEPNRKLMPMVNVAPNLAEMYKHRNEPGFKTGDEVLQDAIDTGFALIKFKSGAIGQLVITDTSHGHSLGIETITGSEGTLFRTQSRSGKPAKIVFMDGKEVIGEELLKLVPSFELDDLTTTLWNGRRRIGQYDMGFHDTDSRILAYEYMDWVRAVEKSEAPEVGVLEGKNALGLAYSIVESGLSQKKVKVRDVISGEINGYQKDIDISEEI